MAIRMRRGLEEDFDPEKMVPGEWAVSTDTRYVRMCFATGIVLRMATYEAFEADMQEIQNILATCQDIQKAVEKFEGLAEQHAATAQSYSIESKSWSDSAKSYSEEATRQANLAKTYAEKASEVTEIDYATQDRAGIIKGGENHIAEDGTLEMTKRTTDRTLYNSYAGGIKTNEVVGKSEQRTTTGKNLLNPTLGTTTLNGVTCTNNGDGTYTLNGKASDISFFELGSISPDNKTYKITGCPSGASIDTYYLDVTNNVNNASKDYGNGAEITLTGSDIYSCKISIKSGVTVNNILFKPMITTDLDATYEDYEPYTGGIPSPNPDYPQEIKSVEVGEIKSVGKNLLNPTLETTTKNGITCTANGDGTYTLNGTATANTWFAISDKFKIKSNETVKLIASKNNNTFSKVYAQFFDDYYVNISGDVTENTIYTIPNEAVCANFTIAIYKGKTVTNEIAKPMITTDLTATYDDYAPYTSSKVTLSSPLTLRAIGDAKDRIVRKDGVWGIERNVAEIASYNGESITTEYISTTGGLDTGATVDYVLAATTFEPLPEADQKAFHTLQSYDTVTYISTDSEIEPVIDLEYGTSRVGAYTLEAWNNAENNKIMLEELTTAMLVMNQE